MEKEITEVLEIQNFLSIKQVKWDFSQFNVITGDMGTGKSLCIKLLKFFEDIIPNLLVMSYSDFLKNLDSNTFFNYLVGEFTNVFYFATNNPNGLPSFTINYTFSYREEEIKISITGKNADDIIIRSTFLETLLGKWSLHLQNKTKDDSITPDGFDEAKRFFYAEILKMFNTHFPMSTTFIPASRAALAVSSEYTDNYLKSYNNLINILIRYKKRDLEIVNTILKAKIEIDDKIYLISPDGRKVPLAKASSGQQEIIYLLMLLDRLGNFNYSYGKTQSIFIEEPEAHLFPLEQKQTMEFIVHMYNILKGNGSPIRVFITTHSPYVLNTINNTLEKGRLIKNTEKIGDIEKKKIICEKIDSISHPALSIDDVSAYMIGSDGNVDSMINTDDEEKYIYSSVIDKIANSISIDSGNLFDIDCEIKENLNL